MVLHDDRDGNPLDRLPEVFEDAILAGHRFSRRRHHHGSRPERFGHPAQGSRRQRSLVAGPDDHRDVPPRRGHRGLDQLFPLDVDHPAGFAEDAEDGHAVDPDVRHETDDPSERFQVDVFPIVERRRKNRINSLETTLERHERSPPGGGLTPWSFPGIMKRKPRVNNRLFRGEMGVSLGGY
ncbi:MAG: hypothetical protein NUW14_12995 [Deltaproteobacteria bacterium]|nr:hypothetical protein [Deltaproteobacteria bacterium]